MNTRNATILALAAFLAIAVGVALSSNPVYAQYAPCQGYGGYGSTCYPGSSYYPNSNCGYYYSGSNCNYQGYGYPSYPYNNCGYNGCYPYYRPYNPYTTYNCWNGYYYATGYCSYYGSCRTCR
ncbi:MAG TPA: hypothetical protein VEI80_07195 [Candidatus Acidoferrales bacterium]|nr:hypothetical protein [Candidatus Acidoferrales bacterium]